MIRFFRKSPFFIRLFHWEYWSFHTVYGPIYIVWIFICLRTRSFFFFNLGNPSIENGGFLMESKFSIYQQLPAGTYPDTLFVVATLQETALPGIINNSKLCFPLIAKPDIGMRGMAVKKLNSLEELVNYHRQITVNYLLQNFVTYPEEAGIFYYRYPDQQKGKISGIVYKEVLKVKGNGKDSIRQLLQQQPRYILQLPALEKEHGELLHRVLHQEEEWLLPYGNHALGARFLDVTDKADKVLTELIDNYCQQIPDFYFGRMDIRFESWELLKAGQNFSVIELNGTGSEPTHMYDPRHSLFFAWKEIIRHWLILSRICRMNKKNKGLLYMTFKQGRQMFKDNSAYIRKLKSSPLVN